MAASSVQPPAAAVHILIDPWKMSVCDEDEERTNAMEMAAAGWASDGGGELLPGRRLLPSCMKLRVFRKRDNDPSAASSSSSPFASAAEHSDVVRCLVDAAVDGTCLYVRREDKAGRRSCSMWIVGSRVSAFKVIPIFTRGSKPLNDGANALIICAALDGIITIASLFLSSSTDHKDGDDVVIPFSDIHLHNAPLRTIIANSMSPCSQGNPNNFTFVLQHDVNGVGVPTVDAVSFVFDDGIVATIPDRGIAELINFAQDHNTKSLRKAMQNENYKSLRDANSSYLEQAATVVVSGFRNFADSIEFMNIGKLPEIDNVRHRGSSSDAALLRGEYACYCGRVAPSPLDVLKANARLDSSIIAIGKSPGLTVATMRQQNPEVSAGKIITEVASKLTDAALGFVRGWLGSGRGRKPVTPTSTNNEFGVVAKAETSGSVYVKQHRVASSSPPAISLFMQEVSLTHIVCDPTRRFVALIDQVSRRVYVVDIASGLICRLFKGCRAVQVGWILGDVDGCSRLFIVTYLSTRGVIEMHSMSSRARSTACTVGKHCLLVNDPLFSSSSLMLFDCDTGSVREVFVAAQTQRISTPGAEPGRSDVAVPSRPVEFNLPAEVRRGCTPEEHVEIFTRDHVDRCELPVDFIRLCFAIPLDSWDPAIILASLRALRNAVSRRFSPAPGDDRVVSPSLLASLRGRGTDVVAPVSTKKSPEPLVRASQVLNYIQLLSTLTEVYLTLKELNQSNVAVELPRGSTTRVRDISGSIDFAAPTPTASQRAAAYINLLKKIQAYLPQTIVEFLNEHFRHGSSHGGAALRGPPLMLPLSTFVTYFWCGGLRIRPAFGMSIDRGVKKNLAAMTKSSSSSSSSSSNWAQLFELAGSLLGDALTGSPERDRCLQTLGISSSHVAELSIRLWIGLAADSAAHPTLTDASAVTTFNRASHALRTVSTGFLLHEVLFALPLQVSTPQLLLGITFAVLKLDTVESADAIKDVVAAVQRTISIWKLLVRSPSFAASAKGTCLADLDTRSGGQTLFDAIVLRPAIDAWAKAVPQEGSAKPAATEPNEKEIPTEEAAPQVQTESVTAAAATALTRTLSNYASAADAPLHLLSLAAAVTLFDAARRDGGPHRLAAAFDFAFSALNSGFQSTPSTEAVEKISLPREFISLCTIAAGAHFCRSVCAPLQIVLSSLVSLKQPLSFDGFKMPLRSIINARTTEKQTPSDIKYLAVASSRDIRAYFDRCRDAIFVVMQIVRSLCVKKENASSSPPSLEAEKSKPESGTATTTTLPTLPDDCPLLLVKVSEYIAEEIAADDARPLSVIPLQIRLDLHELAALLESSSRCSLSELLGEMASVVDVAAVSSSIEWPLQPVDEAQSTSAAASSSSHAISVDWEVLFTHSALQLLLVDDYHQHQLHQLQPSFVQSSISAKRSFLLLVLSKAWKFSRRHVDDAERLRAALEIGPPDLVELILLSHALNIGDESSSARSIAAVVSVEEAVPIVLCALHRRIRRIIAHFEALEQQAVGHRRLHTIATAQTMSAFAVMGTEVLAWIHATAPTHFADAAETAAPQKEAASLSDFQSNSELLEFISAAAALSCSCVQMFYRVSFNMKSPLWDAANRVAPQVSKFLVELEGAMKQKAALRR